MKNPTYAPLTTADISDRLVPYPAALDRVYYVNETFTDTSEWSTLSNLSGLRFFYVFNCNFPTGTPWSIFDGLGSISSLIRIYINRNTGLTGTLPAAWGSLGSLRYLHLDRQLGVAPTVPASWSGMSRLQFAYLRSMGWSTSQVDTWLSSFAAAATAGLGSAYGSGKRLYLTNWGPANPNAAPTGGASHPAILTLNSLGWTVYHN